MSLERVMLANNYKNQNVSGWFVCEKLDGMRAFWEPSSRGKRKGEIYYSHHTREYDICTGLWSRYGNIIFAPNWWLYRLPLVRCLDGEL